MIAGTGRGPQTRRSALHQNRGNKARMYMKTKDEVKKSRSPSPGSLLSPPSLPMGEGCSRGLFGEPKHCATHKNRGNELKKSLKKKEDGCYKVRKRTQNEAKFEHQWHGSNPNSEVARRDGKQSLTRLATLATFSPTGEGPLMRFVFSVQKSGEQSQNVYENKGQVQNVAESCSSSA
jgi:hypothetical protein